MFSFLTIVLFSNGKWLIVGDCSKYTVDGFFSFIFESIKWVRGGGWWLDCFIAHSWNIIINNDKKFSAMLLLLGVYQAFAHPCRCCVFFLLRKRAHIFGLSFAHLCAWAWCMYIHNTSIKLKFTLKKLRNYINSNGKRFERESVS